jgi:hypothetical protein
MAGRDSVETKIYGMEGVPTEIIEERLVKKVRKKKNKLEAELKKKFGIDLDDPKFDLNDYEVAEPRPRKRQKLHESFAPMPRGFMGGPPRGIPPPIMVGIRGPPAGNFVRPPIGLPPPGSMPQLRPGMMATAPEGLLP